MEACLENLSVADVRELNAALCRENFAEYCAYMLPDGEEPAAHHRVMCDALQKVERGEIKRLMINMPPGGAKSTYVSQLFSGWMLGRHPEHEIIFISYASDKALKQSRKARNYFIDPKYNEIFPHVKYQPSREGKRVIPIERQAAQEWGTIQGGTFFATGIGGGSTSLRMNLGIIDDPVKDRIEADSPVVQNNTWDWYKDVFHTRKKPGAAIIIIQTRWSTEDLSGKLLREMNEGNGDDWTVISIPAINEKGEAYWPDYYAIEEMEREKAQRSERSWESLYQQNPTVPGGSLFKRTWWDGIRYDAVDPQHSRRCVSRVQSWDTAEVDSATAAYTSCGTGEMMPNYKAHLTHVFRKRLEFPALLEAVTERAKAANYDGKLKAVLIENKSSGVQSIQTIMTQGEPWLKKLIVPVTPCASKPIRANGMATWCEKGWVLLPKPSNMVPWLLPFEDEIFAPLGSGYMDQIDMFSQLIWYWERYFQTGLEGTLPPLDTPAKNTKTKKDRILERLNGRMFK